MTFHLKSFYRKPNKLLHRKNYPLTLAFSAEQGVIRQIRGDMAKVECEVELSTDYNDDNREVECVVVTCMKCGHETKSWGYGEASIKRCMALMNEECPEGEKNYYVEQ